MQVIEHCTIGKIGNPDRNEDGIFMSPAFAAVIDGCSSIVPPEPFQKSSGVIARELIGEALAALNPAATKEEAFSALNNAIHSWYEGQGGSGVFEAHPELRASAYCAIASVARREVWVLGDCQALISGRVHTHHKRVDSLMEELRAFIIEHLLLEGYSEADLLKEPSLVDRQLRPIMALQPAFQNRAEPLSYTYAALDGFFSAYSAIICIPLTSAPVEVALATDGYPKIRSTLEASEEHLMRIIASDPLLYTEFRSTKGVVGTNRSFDDRSYLRFIV
ncbi:MAG: hypothetical protein RBQ65_03825 [Sphaerochaeta sp.]|nr:hypothetical protein [Sphaerochaeta sp.]